MTDSWLLVSCVFVTAVSAQLEYGADISFPMHRNVSINYPWLPHNVDPSIPTPDIYKGMPIQPLGDKHGYYDHYLQGCVDRYGEKGERCIKNEKERIEMSLRQPQSMVVSLVIGKRMESSTFSHRFLYSCRTTPSWVSPRFVLQIMSSSSSGSFGMRTRTRRPTRVGPWETPTQITGPRTPKWFR